MSRLRKRVRIGKYAIPALLLLTLAIGSVAAVAYVILTYTMTATVVANPKVTFIKWSDGTKVNIFDYPVSIFPSITTIDENSTNGIWNWDTAAHSCSLWIQGITLNTNIQKVYIKVYNGAGTLFTITWNNGESLPQTPTSFTAAASTKYTIWIEVTAASGATIGAAPVITVNMKVLSP